MNWKRSLLFIFVLINAFCAFADSEGPESGGGGGGTVALTPAHSVLSDFYNFADPLNLLFKIYQKNLLLNDDLNSLVLRSDVMMRAWVFGNSSEPTLLSALDAQKNIRWVFINKFTFSLPFYRGPYLDNSQVINVAAYYQTSTMTVFLSSEEWAKMDITSKLGLILHEKLRRLQLSLSYNLSEKSLQMATVTMLACKPAEDQSKVVLQLKYLFMLTRPNLFSESLPTDAIQDTVNTCVTN